jgi:hypothetical protein
MNQQLGVYGQFNTACRALGLDWDVDGTVCRGNNGGQSEREVVRTYITAYRAHLLSCYELDFLVDLVLEEKAARTAAGSVAIEPYSPL